MSRTIRNKEIFSDYDKFEDFHRSRDRKPWWKPNKEFKQLKRRQERSRSKQALREGRDPSRQRKTDVWDWN